MTKDLALLIGPEQPWQTSEQFLATLADNLKSRWPDVPLAARCASTHATIRSAISWGASNIGMCRRCRGWYRSMSGFACMKCSV